MTSDIVVAADDYRQTNICISFTLVALPTFSFPFYLCCTMFFYFPFIFCFCFCFVFNFLANLFCFTSTRDHFVCRTNLSDKHLCLFQAVARVCYDLFALYFCRIILSVTEIFFSCKRSLFLASALLFKRSVETLSVAMRHGAWNRATGL